MTTQTRRPRKSKTETTAAAQTTDPTPGRPKRTRRAAAKTIATPAAEPIAEPVPAPDPAPEPEQAPAARPEPIAAPAKRGRKAKAEPVLFDPADLAPAGQLWHRKTNFDHQHVLAEAWVLITRETAGSSKQVVTTAFCWMTYDRRLGKADPMGRPIPVADHVDYIHKIGRKGYRIWTSESK